MGKLLIGLALLILVIFGAAICFSLGWLSRFTIQGLTPDLVLQCATALGGLALALWSYRRTKDAEYLARQFPQKAEIYEQLLAEIKSVQTQNNPALGGIKIDENELAKRLLDIKFKAIIWGDQKLLSSLADIETPATDNIDLFDKWARLYEQMRRELGHRDQKGYGWDIIMLSIIQEDKPGFASMKVEALRRRASKS